jgi:hypothetical protein
MARAVQRGRAARAEQLASFSASVVLPSNKC